VNSHFSAILFLFAFLLEVAHDAIPHHHPEQNEIELTARHNHDGPDYLDDTAEHQHSFLPHQHYYCAEDLTPARVGNPVQKDFKKVFCDLVLMSPNESQELHKPPGIKNLLTYSVSLQNYPFILSPNAMRGSPCMA